MTMAAIRVLKRRDILTVLTAADGDGIRAGMEDASTFLGSRKAVALWLLAVALVILSMITIGGLTRLTGSGLSITEWKPIMGVLPPLSDAAWADAFAKYQRIPQFTVEN